MKRKSFTKELIWIYAVGLTGMIVPWTRPYFLIITPLNLLVVVALLFYNHRIWGVRTVVAFAVVGLFSFFLEALGVNTGLIFGSYEYGATLGPTLLNTPVMIGVNWILLVYICHSVATKMYSMLPAGCLAVKTYYRFPALVVAVTGALLMLGYDIVLEPAAIQLDMWSWYGGTIPVKNYITWFVLSFAFILYLGMARVDTRNPTALPVYIVQLTFFLSLNLWFLIMSFVG